MAVSMLREGISGILTCGICLEDMTEPRMLVCHHSFCTACLKSIELIGAGYQQKLQCPKCRKFTNVPRGIVSHLPMDCNLNELSELQKRAARLEVSQPVKPEKDMISESVACVLCARQTSDDYSERFFFYYCNNCHDYMCNGCKEAHTGVPLFKEHELSCLAGKSRHLQKQICQNHSMKSKDYHCEECREIVCSVCVVISHREHTVRPFEQYDEICRKEVDKQRIQLYKVFHVPVYFQLYRYTGDITKPLMACLHTATDKMTTKINDAADNISKDIERQRVELISVVQKQQRSIQKILNAHILQKRCSELWGSKEPGLLLRHQQGLLEEIESFFHENDDGEEIPKLTVESELYDEFSTETKGNSIGSLSAKTLKEFIAEHKLAN